MSMISRQKLIEEYYDKIVGGYDMGCRPEDCKEAELLGESCMECVMRRTGELIFSQPPADQWISCSERLPGVADEYEVTVDCDGKLFTTNSFYSVCESEWSTWVNHITAWRERLPEPYKGVE